MGSLTVYLCPHIAPKVDGTSLSIELLARSSAFRSVLLFKHIFRCGQMFEFINVTLGSHCCNLFNIRSTTPLLTLGEVPIGRGYLHRQMVDFAPPLAMFTPPHTLLFWLHLEMLSVSFRTIFSDSAVLFADFFPSVLPM